MNELPESDWSDRVWCWLMAGTLAVAGAFVVANIAVRILGWPNL